MVVVTVLASIALRIPGLTESLWHDEIFRTRVVLGSDRGLSFLLHDVHNPLYNGLMLGWISVFGDSEVSVRFPSLIAGYGLAWLTWAWGRHRFGGFIAWWACAWLLLSPVSIWYSTEAKNSMFSAFFALWTIAAHDNLLRAGRDRHVRAAAGAVAAGTLAILCDFQVLLVLLPVWGLMVWDAWRRKRVPVHHEAWHAPRTLTMRRLLLVFAGCLLLAAPLLVFKAANRGELTRDYLYIFAAKQVLGFLGNWMPTGNVLPSPAPNMWPLWYVPPAAVVIVLLVIGMRANRASTAGRMVSLVFFLSIFFYLTASAIFHAAGDSIRLYQDRNLIILLALYPLLLLRGVAELRPGLRRAAVAVFIGVAAFSSLLIDTVLADKWTVMAPNPDWQSASRYIDHAQQARTVHEGREEPMLVISRASLSPLRYYTLPATLVEIPRTADMAEAVTDTVDARPDRDFMLVYNRYTGYIAPHSLRELDERFPVVEKVEVRAMTIEHRRVLRRAG